MPRCAARCAVGPFLLLCFALPALRAQDTSDWRAPGIASFDEAWRVVNETFYDPTFGGLDWPGVHAELRPRLASASTPDEQRAVIREMLARLGQSHFELISSVDPGLQQGPAVVAIDIRILVGRAVITSVEPGSAAEAAGLRPGMQILGVDGRRVESLIDAVTITDDRQRRVRMWEGVYRLLRGSEGSTAELEVADGDRPGRVVAVMREPPVGEIVTFGNMPSLRARLESRGVTSREGRSVGLIRFNIWMAVIAEPFAAAIDIHRGAAGIVIDLRGNPGGLADMIRGVAGHVMNEPALIGRLRLRRSDLELRANPRRATSDGRPTEPFAGPVAILVDELSASASECFAAGLQSLGRARVFGTRTMGQALPASTRRLPNGDTLIYAVGDFVTATGQRVEAWGVLPDEVVPHTIESLRAGADAALDAALAWIDARSR